MKLHLNSIDQINLIQSCVSTEQSFRLQIAGNYYSNSLILTPENIEMWGVSEVSELGLDEFGQLSREHVEVVVLGTGNTLVFPDPALTKPVVNAGIGIEVMDTQAACRTYNILAGDGRKVIAGLIL